MEVDLITPLPSELLRGICVSSPTSLGKWVLEVLVSSGDECFHQVIQ